MRVRKVLSQRLIEMRKRRLDRNILRREALEEIEYEKEELNDASKSSRQEDSREIDWEGSRALLIEGEGKEGSKSKKRDKARVETEKEKVK